MSYTTDPKDPRLAEQGEGGKPNAVYLVLSEEERAKGFVRPVRRSYQHTGMNPLHPLRPLTDEECARYEGEFVAFEDYPDGGGRFWTQAELDNNGCGSVTVMGLPLAETYARDPKFYGATYCGKCGEHFPVEEFVWDADGSVVGS